jgi:hypothetical protein
MGKSRKMRIAIAAEQACRPGHPGSDGKAETASPGETRADLSRTSEFRMVLDESVQTVLARPSAAIATNNDHPLAGLSPQRRTQERIDAIASILARLALKANSKESRVSE